MSLYPIISQVGSAERRRGNQRRYKAAHPDRVAESQRKWDAASYRASRRDELAAASRAYYAAHREERIAAHAAWVAAHPDHSANYEAARREQRAAYNAAAREKRRAHKAMRRGAPRCDHAGCLALGATQVAWVTNPHTCYLCGTPVWRGVNLHMDHVVPLTRGGIHCAENIRPACAPCNLAKGAKAPMIA